MRRASSRRVYTTVAATSSPAGGGVGVGQLGAAADQGGAAKPGQCLPQVGVGTDEHRRELVDRLVRALTAESLASLSSRRASTGPSAVFGVTVARPANTARRPPRRPGQSSPAGAGRPGRAG
jgi:hypothetical protein